MNSLSFLHQRLWGSTLGLFELVVAIVQWSIGVWFFPCERLLLALVLGDL